MSSHLRPNCIVTVRFYLDPTSFSYACSACSEGWIVQSDGSIYPPSKSRVVEFRLNAYSADPEGSPAAVFSGFQIAESPDLGTQKWTPVAAFPPNVKVIAPTPYPPANDKTPGPLTLDFTDIVGTHRLFYRLAVNADGEGPYWDDPRIYDDGSE